MFTVLLSICTIQVYFSGVNWDGFEYPDCVIDGVRPGMNRSFLGHLDQMKRVGFNLIRLPFAGTCIQPGVYPNKGSVDYTYNQPLVVSSPSTPPES